jgi:hypothetical protein
MSERIINEMSTQPGMLIERNSHCTFAQLPSPLRSIANTSDIGNVSKRYSTGGPQLGIFSSGRLCNHNCFAEKYAPVTELRRLRPA